MQARAGDHLIAKGHHVGQPDRDGEVIEVRGDDGGPPYLVRWAEDGHVGLFFPGADTFVERRRTRTTGKSRKS
jgi:hypothetical protein